MDKKSFTLIDGYNVLHECGFISNRGGGPKMLEKARMTFLGFLAKYLNEEQRARCTVVFDSSEKVLPNRLTIHNILVEFANEYASADELICLLIRKHHAAKLLTVVSSDHQIQKVAKTRNAKFLDSGDWFEQLTMSSDTITGGQSQRRTPRTTNQST